MLKKGTILASIACVALLGLAGCSDDDNGGTCGDGVLDANEECDLQQLGGMTCADVVQGSSGTLACNADCTYNTDQCAVCGDGVRNFGEQCDCGDDPNNLPADCTDVNGGADANCDAECSKIAYCGDGVQDQGEDCDCGDDPNDLPQGCDDVNGGANANCTDTCEEIAECATEGAWMECDSLELNPCCDDDWGASMDCVSLSTTELCLRSCTDHSECYWSNYCESQIGACYIQLCGGNPQPPQTPIAPMEQCALPSGNPGICVPAFPREDTQGNPTPSDLPQGLCMGEENPSGGLEQGDTCDVFEDSLSVDRSEDMCNYGRCLAAQGETTGTCAQYCSWEDNYDAAFYGETAPWLTCATGTNCVGLETIDPTTGLTGGNYGLCWETVAEVGETDGMTSCSLVTGQVLNDPSSLCSDLADFPDGRCVPLLFDQSTGERTDGSLLGVCMGDDSCGGCSAGEECVGGSCLSVLAVWDTCDPQSTSNVCPAQTVCLETDAFAATPAGDTVCVPYCDIDHPDGPTQHCDDLGAQVTGGATPICTSWSQAYGAGGQADVRQSRLGVCLTD
jgi:hypothetical protein